MTMTKTCDDRLAKIISETDPITLFTNAYSKTSDDYLVCIHILISLLAMDNVLEEVFGKRCMYIQNDRSVFYLMERAQCITVDELTFNRCVLILDFTKLIYRFTCAKKFNLQDTCVKQLRINSWGREYITTTQSDFSTDYDKYYDAFKSYCLKYKSIYSELVNLLSQSITAEVALKIESINRTVDIRLLS